MVVSGGRKENFTIPYNNNDQLTDNSKKMAGKAVLLCRSNSHPFQDRTFLLDQPVKIGRSVARARPSPNNGIFDCKVLSRNHAIFWYSNGKFFLQDTKSSNGTFVNNQRLGKSGEDSQPREVCSGDIVQFGVEVLENSRKVTHGCIVANLKLYLPDGKGAKCSPSMPATLVSSTETLPMKDLYKLDQNIQEALQREHSLKKKIDSLQEMIAALKLSSECGWKALISEDRLLSRVEILENQLRIYSKNFSEDKLRDELKKLQEDKNVYQGAAKEYLKKVLEEKLEAVNRCQQLEMELANREAECTELKEGSKKCQQELQELAQRHSNHLIKLESLQAKLEETIEQHNNEVKHLEFQNDEYRMSLEKALENGHCLQQRIDNLESASELNLQQLITSQKKLQNMPLPNINLKNLTGTITEIIVDENEKQKNAGSEELKELRTRLSIVADEERENKDFISLLSAQLELLRQEKMMKIQDINNLEAIVESFNEDVSNFKERKTMIEDVINSLPPKIEKVLDLPMELRTRVGNSQNECQPITKESLMELLEESREKAETAEKDLAIRKEEVEHAKVSLVQLTQNFLAQDERLMEAIKVQNELESTIENIKKQIESMSVVISLPEKNEEECLSGREQVTNKDIEEIESLKRQLLDAQQAAKQTHNEMESMRDRLLHLEAVQREQQEGADQVRRQLPIALDELNQSQQLVSSLKACIQRLENQNTICQGEVDVLKQELAVAVKQSATIKEEEKASSAPVISSLEMQISNLRQEIVQHRERYMRLAEEKSNIELELQKIRFQYESLTHHPYFVHLLSLVIVIFAFYVFYFLLS